MFFYQVFSLESCNVRKIELGFLSLSHSDSDRSAVRADEILGIAILQVIFPFLLSF